MLRRLVPFTLCLMSLSAGALSARAATSLEAGGIGSMERSDAGIGLLAGLRFEGLRRQAAGSNVGISVFANSGGSSGAAWAGAAFDLGAGYGMPLASGGLLVPRAGFTALGTVGEGGGGLWAGVMAGLGAVSLPEHGVGARVDATVRWVFSPSELLLAVTLGLVWPGQQP